MRGGVILYRGAGADARRYLESDRSRADDYYIEGGTALAHFVVVDEQGWVVVMRELSPADYAGWVDWTDPLTGESIGNPRLAGDGRSGSPRFAELVVNVPKSLSIAAALHPEVSAALDVAEYDAAAELRSWLGRHSVTRVGPRGFQEIVPVERLQTIAVSHKTSRTGDPHRHIHFQIGTRVWAARAWRGLDTAALFRQQGALRAMGTAVLAAHPYLAAVLDAHGLTLDPATGEVVELAPFNGVLSKRSKQVIRNLAALEREWRAAHPGEEPGRVLTGRWQGRAWDQDRPSKKPTRLGSEAGWKAELVAAGWTPNLPRGPVPRPVSLNHVSTRQVASRAVDRCAATASTWTWHDLHEHVTRLLTETGVRASPHELREFVSSATELAADGCLSVLPGGVTAEHVAHLTSAHVIAVEARLRNLLTASAAPPAENPTIVDAAGLDEDQRVAAAAIASSTPLVVVEGAAGAGKTTMLAAAIITAAADGRKVRVVTPTKKAADVAHRELGVPADSVAKLVHKHGWRWNRDGVWTRLSPGDTDPTTGTPYLGPSEEVRVGVGERIVVDEAGMLDQDTAVALLTLTREVGATLALVGDRAQLAAVGRGGVLDMAALIAPTVQDMTGVHRFTDPDYGNITLRLRTGEDPVRIFDDLHLMGLVHLHDTADDAEQAIAAGWAPDGAVSAATNEENRSLNARIRADRVRSGTVDDTRTVTGSDGLPIGVGDRIQTRRNYSTLHVANRQTWDTTRIDADGAVWAAETTARGRPRMVRLPGEYVAEHTHLAYATTVHGIQGATVNTAHTLLSDTSDVASVYVALTRGRTANHLHVIAANLDDARAQFVDAVGRDRADRGLTDATRNARTATDRLVSDGPIRLVTAERERLALQRERARAAVAALERRAAAPREQGPAVAQLARRATRYHPVAHPRVALKRWRAHLDGVERLLAELETLPPNQAATIIRARHAAGQQRQAEQELRDTQRNASTPTPPRTPSRRLRL